jgi:hypothetical protein
MRTATDPASQPGGGAGLIGALAPGNHLEIPAQHGFAGRGQPRDRDHKVHVQAAHHRQRRSSERSIPNFFSSSA